MIVRREADVPPDPFDGVPVHLWLRARRTPVRVDASDGDLRAALACATEDALESAALAAESGGDA